MSDPGRPRPEDPAAIAAADSAPGLLAAADPLAARTFVEGLFARHQGEIYAFLLRMVRDPELAADLAQDAFIR
ncbi:MAG: hypothetical protein MUE51_15765, partial [Thermoleophilia bacterium]|nr:hypothetical protein [Thermoleophilia bacterium]